MTPNQLVNLKLPVLQKIVSESFHLHAPLIIIPLSVQKLAESHSHSDLATPLVGLLVVQDIQLGLLVALMPFMRGSDSSWLFWALQLIQVVFGFPLLLFLTRGLTYRLLEVFYK